MASEAHGVQRERALGRDCQLRAARLPARAGPRAAMRALLLHLRPIPLRRRRAHWLVVEQQTNYLPLINGTVVGFQAIFERFGASLELWRPLRRQKSRFDSLGIQVGLSN